MQVIVLDFETYFDDEYTLKKLTTEAYVRDPRFEALGVSMYVDPSVPEGVRWVGQEHLADFFEDKEWWGQQTVCAHHAQFDGLILAHHFDVKPKFWIDTLSMARLTLPGTVRASLDSLCNHYGLPPKIVPYNLFKGRRWINLDPETRRLLGEGAIGDAQRTRHIAQQMLPNVPPEELYLIDKTIRMFTEPALVGDIPYLEKFQHDEWQRKNELLHELGTTQSELQSADKFCALLEAEGVEIEMKAGKNGDIPAIAKTDDFMKGLAEHENERVAALAGARLEVKSTIDETRAGRLVGMARRGPMCVYLTYSGASDTHRDSGGDKINWQNFKRTGTLKKGIAAPAGYLIADPDSSQIECRLLNEIAGQHDIVAKFRNKEDIYCDLASKIYGFPVTGEDKPRRGVGKQGELSCGYGSGGPKFQATAKRGTYGPPVVMTDEEAQHAVDTYRAAHPCVTARWREAGRMISALAGTDKPVQWGPMIVHTGEIELPNGTILHFPDLHFDQTTQKWRYAKRKGLLTKIYGSKLVAITTQALARVITFGAAARIIKQSGLKMVNREHDKLVFLVPNDQYAEQTNEWLKQQMCVAPDWLPNIPLAAEGELKERLG